MTWPMTYTKISKRKDYTLSFVSEEDYKYEPHKLCQCKECKTMRDRSGKSITQRDIDFEAMLDKHFR